MKSAGGSVNRKVLIDISSDEAENIRVLEKKLQDQKGYTKKQAEKAAELQIKLQESRKEKEALHKKLTAALAANQHARQQVSRDNKPLKRLVRQDQTRSGQKAAETDPQPQPAGVNGDDRSLDTPKEPSMREFYSDFTFNSDSPWGSSTLPDPDPKTFRQHGWRKTAYRPYDQARLMNVHLHRQFNCTREPVRMSIQPNLDGEDNGSNTTALNGPADSVDVEMTNGIQLPVGGGHQITFDEFIGIPDNMVPYVKDGSLGFRSGIIVSHSFCSKMSYSGVLTSFRIHGQDDLSETSLTIASAFPEISKSMSSIYLQFYTSSFCFVMPCD
jgi:hypothetical protein